MLCSFISIHFAFHHSVNLLFYSHIFLIFSHSPFLNYVRDVLDLCLHHFLCPVSCFVSCNCLSMCAYIYLFVCVCIFSPFALQFRLVFAFFLLFSFCHYKTFNDTLNDIFDLTCAVFAICFPPILVLPRCRFCLFLFIHKFLLALFKSSFLPSHSLSLPLSVFILTNGYKTCQKHFCLLISNLYFQFQHLPTRQSTIVSFSERLHFERTCGGTYFRMSIDGDPNLIRGLIFCFSFSMFFGNPCLIPHEHFYTHTHSLTYKLTDGYSNAKLSPLVVPPLQQLDDDDKKCIFFFFLQTLIVFLFLFAFLFHC